MSSGERALGFGDLVGSAFEDLVDGIEIDEVGRNGHDIHCGDGATAHRVDVGKGIGGRDLAVKVRVVDDGGEKIEGLDEGGLVVNTVNCGVIGTRGTDEEIGVGDVGEATQNLRQLGLAELGGSSSAGGQFCQAFDVFATHGRESSGRAGFEKPFRFAMIQLLI